MDICYRWLRVSGVGGGILWLVGVGIQYYGGG